MAGLAPLAPFIAGVFVRVWGCYQDGSAPSVLSESVMKWVVPPPSFTSSVSHCSVDGRGIRTTQQLRLSCFMLSASRERLGRTPDSTVAEGTLPALSALGLLLLGQQQRWVRPLFPARPACLAAVTHYVSKQPYEVCCGDLDPGDGRRHRPAAGQ